MGSNRDQNHRTSFVGRLRRLLRFRSFQQKLGVCAFIMSLLAVSSVSLISYLVARNQIKKDREQLMQAQARQTSENLQDELNNMAEDLRLWSKIGDVPASLRGHQSENANHFFGETVRQRKIYDLIFTIDLDGRICSINSQGERLLHKPYGILLWNLPDSWLENVIGSDYVHAVEPLREFPAVNAICGRNADSEIPDRRQLVLAAAVRDDTGEAVGIIVAIVNWSYFQSLLDRVQKRFEDLDINNGYAFLAANDHDTLIGHKNREEYDKTATGYRLYQVLDMFENDPDGTTSYEYLGNEKTIGGAAVNPQQLKTEIDWRLGVGINNEDIFRPIQMLKFWFFLISLTIAAMAGAISVLFGRAVSVSLKEFTQLARDASKGSFVKMVKQRTHDELGNLAQAFNEMLVSFRAQMPFVRIPNPYVVGTPIRTSDMFYGRQEDLNWISDQLARSGNVMVVLYGARRVGKTSLLHQINSERTTARILPFFFDTQQLVPEINSNSDFYHVLTRDMLFQIPEKLPGFKAPFIAADRFTPQTFRNLLEFLRDAEPEKKPVLLFDEMENLEYKLARGDLTSDILLFLAGLLDSNIPISFVITGSNMLEAKKLPDWAILVPKTVSRKIGLLESGDALRLIEDPAKSYFVYDDGIPDQILRMTAGHPYYTQVVCQAQIDYLNNKHEFAMGQEQLAQVVEKVLNHPPPPLNHVWDSFSAAEKTAATLAANAIGGPEAYADVESMLHDLPAEIASLSGNRVNFINAVESLVREDWMERSEHESYRFKVDLLRLWIRREHTIWHLADEFNQGIV